MSESISWRLQCESCKLKYPSVIAAYFSFDRHGTLHINGVCRFCLQPVHMTHSADEVAADIREAHNKWADNYGQDQIDLKLWEQQMREDDDGT